MYQPPQQSPVKPADPPAQPAAGNHTAPSGPLDAAHYQQLEHARHQGKKIRRAIKVALFGGYTTASLAVLSLPFALFDVTNLFISAALGTVAYHELRGASMLKQFKANAAKRLGWNQIFFCACLVCYFAYSMHQAMNTSVLDSVTAASAADLEEMIGSIEELGKTIALVFYGLLIVLSVVFQGGTAWYYFSRRKHITSYREQTPQWIIEVLARQR